MIFILLVFIVMATLTILALIKRDKEGATLSAIGCVAFTAVMGAIILLVSTGLEHENFYVDSKLFDNPVYTQSLEALPFDTTASNTLNITAPNTVYVLRGKNSFNNTIYRYCVETENGLDERALEKPIGGDVYIDYIGANEQPYLECQSKIEKEILIKKPSFWFNFFGWIDYKDYSVGDVYDTTDESCCEIYVFHVPEGSLVRE